MTGAKSLQTRLVLLSVLVALLVTVGCVLSISWNSMGLLRELQVVQAQAVVDAVDRQLQALMHDLQRHARDHAQQLAHNPAASVHAHDQVGHADTLDGLYLARGGRIERTLDAGSGPVDAGMHRLLGGLTLGPGARSGTAINDTMVYLYAVEPVADSGNRLLAILRLDGRRIDAFETLDWQLRLSTQPGSAEQSPSRSLPGSQSVVADDGFHVSMRYAGQGGDLVLHVQRSPVEASRLRQGMILSVVVTGVFCALIATIVGALVGLRWLQPIWLLVDRCRQQRIDQTDWQPIEGLDEVRVLTEAIGDLVARLQQSRRDLEQSLREQEQHERLHSDFVRRILAELGAPLREILIAFQEAETSGDMRALLEVETAATELDERLTLLRGLDRQRDHGASSAIFQSVHLHAFCTRIMRLVEPTAKRSGVTVQLQLDESLCNQVFDSDLMSQCLISLLANAIRAPDCRMVILHVSVTGNALRFRVVDDGSGMPPELAESLLQAIHRGEIQLREPGFGLGLPLVLAQLMHMNSTLELERSDARGTSIAILVPLPTQRHRNESSTDRIT